MEKHRLYLTDSRPVCLSVYLEFKMSRKVCFLAKQPQGSCISCLVSSVSLGHGVLLELHSNSKVLLEHMPSLALVRVVQFMSAQLQPGRWWWITERKVSKIMIVCYHFLNWKTWDYEATVIYEFYLHMHFRKFPFWQKHFPLPILDNNFVRQQYLTSTAEITIHVLVSSLSTHLPSVMKPVWNQKKNGLFSYPRGIFRWKKILD